MSAKQQGLCWLCPLLEILGIGASAGKRSLRPVLIRPAWAYGGSLSRFTLDDPPLARALGHFALFALCHRPPSKRPSISIPAGGGPVGARLRIIFQEVVPAQLGDDLIGESLVFNNSTRICHHGRGPTMLRARVDQHRTGVNAQAL